MENNPYYEEAVDELVARLTAHEGDYDEWIGCPNGWGISIIRTQPTMVAAPGIPPQFVGGSYGARGGLFEVALLDCSVSAEVCLDGPILQEPEGWLSPEQVGAKLREVYALPYQAMEND